MVQDVPVDQSGISDEMAAEFARASKAQSRRRAVTGLHGLAEPVGRAAFFLDVGDRLGGQDGL